MIEQRILNALKTARSGLRASTLAAFLQLPKADVTMVLCRLCLAKQTRCIGDLWFAR